MDAKFVKLVQKLRCILSIYIVLQNIESQKRTSSCKLTTIATLIYCKQNFDLHVLSCPSWIIIIISRPKLKTNWALSQSNTLPNYLWFWDTQIRTIDHLLLFTQIFYLSKKKLSLSKKGKPKKATQSIHGLFTLWNSLNLEISHIHSQEN